MLLHQIFLCTLVFTLVIVDPVDLPLSKEINDIMIFLYLSSIWKSTIYDKTLRGGGELNDVIWY